MCGYTASEIQSKIAVNEMNMETCEFFKLMNFPHAFIYLLKTEAREAKLRLCLDMTPAPTISSLINKVPLTVVPLKALLNTIQFKTFFYITQTRHHETNLKPVKTHMPWYVPARMLIPFRCRRFRAASSLASPVHVHVPFVQSASSPRSAL